MHIIVDIRSEIVHSIITDYASNWVDLWRLRYPDHRVSYIHFRSQECPSNGESVIVSQTNWWRKSKRITTNGNPEIFRCINFSKYPPYDSKIETITHIFDHLDVLYPKVEISGLERIFKIQSKNKIGASYKIIVPSLQIGQEAVSLDHIREEKIEIIPYLKFSTEVNHTNILSQFSITEKYFLYDGTYGTESGILYILNGFKQYRDRGWKYILILIGKPTDIEFKNITDQIQKLELTGFVRIVGTLDIENTRSLYKNANGWIYIGAYYAWGPRIELAENYNIPLLISQIPVFQDYFDFSIVIHPNHLSNLWEKMQELENHIPKSSRKIWNEKLMQAYEKIIAERS